MTKSLRSPVKVPFDMSGEERFSSVFGSSGEGSPGSTVSYS